MKDVPDPVDQVGVPALPLVEYCQEALVSMPETLTVPTLVTPSEWEDPLSVAREKVGAAGEVASTVIAAEFCDGVAETLPARSVCRTRIAPMA